MRQPVDMRFGMRSSGFPSDRKIWKRVTWVLRRIEIPKAMIPIPPIHCMNVRQKREVFGVRSTAFIMVNPVLVQPDIASKTLSGIGHARGRTTKGSAPMSASRNHASATATRAIEIRRLVIAGRDQKEQVADREECHRGRGHRQDHIPFLEDRQYKKGYQRNKAEEPADPSHIVDDHGKVIEPLHVR